MKKFLTLIIVALLISLNCLTVAAQTPIAISSEGDLASLVNSKKDFFLEKDIVLSNDFSPIENFRGNFDGRGKKIINLKMQVQAKASGTVYVGLFKDIDGGRVENLTLENVKISVKGATTVYGGGIAGKIISGTVSNCRVGGEISISGGNAKVFAGGIAGVNNGEVLRCENNAKITIDALKITAGGIVGEHPRTEYALTECINNGDILATATAVNNHIGGIVGETSFTVSNCASFGKITLNASGDDTIGGIAADISNGEIKTCYSGGSIAYNGNGDSFLDPIVAKFADAVKFSNNYYVDTVISGLKTSEVKTASALERKSISNAAYFGGFDFDGIWQITANGPTLKVITAAKIEIPQNDGTQSSGSPSGSGNEASQEQNSGFSSTAGGSTSHEQDGVSSTQSAPSGGTIADDDSATKKNAPQIWIFVIIFIVVLAAAGVCVYLIYNKNNFKNKH